jgi:hypothetical protein
MPGYAQIPGTGYGNKNNWSACDKTDQLFILGTVSKNYMQPAMIPFFPGEWPVRARLLSNFVQYCPTRFPVNLQVPNYAGKGVFPPREKLTDLKPALFPAFGRLPRIVFTKFSITFF